MNLNPVTVISFMFTTGSNKFPAQIWSFDNATRVPLRVDFRMQAEIGARMSFYGLVELTDYRPVSGVMYPFRIVSFQPGKPPEIVTLHSVVLDAAAPRNEFNGAGGDIQ